MRKIIYTNKDHLFEELHRSDINQKPDVEIKINPKIKYQKHIGFGGALTDAACITFNYLNKDNKKRYIDSYFSKEGLNYNLIRYPLGSCDFSTHNYQYLETDNIDDLDISADEDRIKMYKQINNVQMDLSVFLVPWSPSAFMKTNNDMNHGGKLKPEYFDLWAKTMAKSAYLLKKQGINIISINTQNEPLATQVWDSCIYTGKEEADFVYNHLLGALKEYGLSDLAIGVWDHNRDVLKERIDETFSNKLKPEDVECVFYHWYSKKDFEQLDYIHDKYPSLHLIMSEGCVELLLDKDGQNSIGNFEHAEVYIHQIINDLNHYCEGYIDWNLSLDSRGGPNHVGNFCEAPIMISENGEMKYMYSYYAIKHFSHFIMPGAYRIHCEINNEDIELVSYLNPDKSTVVIIYNKSNDTHYILNPLNKKEIVELLPHTIYTIL